MALHLLAVHFYHPSWHATALFYLCGGAGMAQVLLHDHEPESCLHPGIAGLRFRASNGVAEMRKEDIRVLVRIAHVKSVLSEAYSRLRKAS